MNFPPLALSAGGSTKTVTHQTIVMDLDPVQVFPFTEICFLGDQFPAKIAHRISPILRNHPAHGCHPYRFLVFTLEAQEENYTMRATGVVSLCEITLRICIPYDRPVNSTFDGVILDYKYKNVDPFHLFYTIWRK